MRQCARTIKSLLYITVTILSAHNSILVITIKKYLRSVILTISRAAGIINNNTKKQHAKRLSVPTDDSGNSATSRGIPGIGHN